MKIIKVSKYLYSPGDVLAIDKQGKPVHVLPELLRPTLKEKFIHNILKKCFSFGQPFCVVCGRAEQVSK